ncbi:DNA-3-methyladenine glycosylase I [Sansalvadorimonas verongulae]|uniref:DNA-3-methyladenine glycosylase I n=1 Tax=Sansalvadorimonas verongulae TaxID=2172824 RepID=UPI002E31562F|nr:DNA-3-methyladenine glycosylase I [Sansalvadorimonas verongulae]
MSKVERVTDGIRCSWCHGDELYREYHDQEWGVPCRNDDQLFEFLVLEGAQAGLSWITVLRKREHYRKVFEGFDPCKVAQYGPEKVEELLHNPGIIRNKLKVNSAIHNAKAYLKVQEKYGSFSRFIWSFVDGETIQNHFTSMAEVPASTEISERMSKALKKEGFNFVGPTICYAFMQATGMVNDHITSCHRHKACGGVG